MAAKKVIIDPISCSRFDHDGADRFETMLGSKKKADKFMADVKNFAVETPFENPGTL